MVETFAREVVQLTRRGQLAMVAGGGWCISVCKMKANPRRFDQKPHQNPQN